MNNYRHGDVILKAPVRLPAGAQKRSGDVVAEGEATGHAHRINGGHVFSYGDLLFVTAGVGASLTHEEHAQEALGPTPDGWAYPVVIQREYDDELEWRDVTD